MRLSQGYLQVYAFPYSKKEFGARNAETIHFKMYFMNRLYFDV